MNYVWSVCSVWYMLLCNFQTKCVNTNPYSFEILCGKVIENKAATAVNPKMLLCFPCYRFFASCFRLGIFA